VQWPKSLGWVGLRGAGDVYHARGAAPLARLAERAVRCTAAAVAMAPPQVCMLTKHSMGVRGQGCFEQNTASLMYAGKPRVRRARRGAGRTRTTGACTGSANPPLPLPAAPAMPALTSARCRCGVPFVLLASRHCVFRYSRRTAVDLAHLYRFRPLRTDAAAYPCAISEV